MRKAIRILMILATLTTTVWAEPNLAGTWLFDATIDARECGDDVKQVELLVTIEKEGEFYTFTFGNASLRGKLSGETLSVRGSYQEEGTITKELTFKVSEDSMEGGGNWTYVTEGYRCKGTEKLTGVRAE